MSEGHVTTDHEFIRKWAENGGGHPATRNVGADGEGTFRAEFWRPRPELNRGKRFCRPLRNHSATWP